MHGFDKYLSAASKGRQDVWIFAMHRYVSDVGFHRLEIVISLGFIELIEHEALHSVSDHSVACVEEEAKILDIWISFEHFCDSDNQLAHVFASDAVGV